MFNICVDATFTVDYVYLSNLSQKYDSKLLFTQMCADIHSTYLANKLSSFFNYKQNILATKNYETAKEVSLNTSVMESIISYNQTFLFINCNLWAILTVSLF